MEGGEKDPPVLQRDKNPSAYRVNMVDREKTMNLREGAIMTLPHTGMFLK